MLKLLLKSVRHYRWASILTPLLVTAEVAIETFIPFLMAAMIDKGITPGNLSYIRHLGVILLIMAGVSLFCGAASSWFSSVAAAGFAKNLRHDVFQNVQRFDFQNLDHFAIPSLVTRLTTDMTNVQTAYQIAIRIAVRAPLLLIFSMIMAFTTNVSMALVYVVVVPIMAVALFVIIRHAKPLFRQVFRKYDRLNQVVSENLRGIRVIKAFVRQQEETTKFESATKDIYDNYTKAQRLIALNTPLMTLMIDVTILVIAWLGAKMIVGGSLQTGQLVSLFSYTMSILFSLMMLSNIMNQLTVSQASGLRIAEVLREKPTIVQPDKPVETVADGRISLESVSFQYPEKAKAPALNHIDLTIQSGAFIGIIGETGSGKSTLVQLLPRLYDATSGMVRIGGVPVQDYDLKTLRDNVAIVLQNNQLFSGTVAENLRWGNAQATDAQVHQAAEIAQADDFIKAMPKGYDTELEQDGHNLSGGQVQRLTIARALLKQPKILILDNATSAVDVATEQQIRQGLKQLAPGMTKLVISQNVSSIAQADEIIVMADGQINGRGSHEQLLKQNAIYQNLNAAQQRQMPAVTPKKGGLGHG